MKLWGENSIRTWTKDSDSFFRVFSLLSGSTFLVHLVNLLAYPFIARLYAPANIGQRALFVSIASILVIYVSWGYEIGVLFERGAYF